MKYWRKAKLLNSLQALTAQPEELFDPIKTVLVQGLMEYNWLIKGVSGSLCSVFSFVQQEDIWPILFDYIEVSGLIGP